MVDRLDLSLVENGLDYVLSAAEHVEGGSARDWKYSLLHLVDGIELVLKARLQQAHWSFLFDDIDKATQAKLASGDFRSTDLEDTLNRLRDLADVALDDEVRRYLIDLRNVRNKVRHFAVNVELDQLKGLLAKGLNFVLEFCRDFLPHALDEETKHQIHEHAREFGEFVAERLKSIEKELGVDAVLWTCRMCSTDALHISEEGPRCHFCQDEPDPEELARQLGEGTMGGECLSCGSETLAFVLFNNEDGASICTTCGNHWQRCCLSCGTEFMGRYDDDGYYCASCFEAAADDS